MTASEVIMIRPCSFGYNEQTAASNHFQNSSSTVENVQERALEEFDKMVESLRSEGIEAIIFEDSPEPHTPDSIFPNNWFATHEDGTIALFPMESENRRLERSEEVINFLESSYRCQRIVDLTDAENIGVYLEGTGSIVFDHDNRLAFACRSSRTDERMLKDYCETIGYSPAIFDAYDKQGNAIYHTNVLMNIGKNYLVICLEAIPTNQQSVLLKTIKKTGKQLITISMDQMNNFAGNMLELKGNQQLISVISQKAFNILDEDQKTAISKTSKLLPISVPTIESIGGGSVRCMMAEIFLLKL